MTLDDYKTLIDQFMDTSILYIKYDTEFLAPYPLYLACINGKDIRTGTLMQYLGKRYDNQTNTILLDNTDTEKNSLGLKMFLNIMIAKKMFEQKDERKYYIPEEKVQQMYSELKIKRAEEIEKLAKQHYEEELKRQSNG